MTVTEHTRLNVTSQRYFGGYTANRYNRAMAKRAAGTAATRARGRLPVPAESVDAERVLAFINTLSARPTDHPLERLDSYEALVAWAREQHLVSAAAADRLIAESRQHPHQAAAVLARAV